jgi:hypothetical protein
VTGKNKTPLLGWHPSSAEDEAWIRAEAKKQGRGALARMLDEALALYRKTLTSKERQT